MNGFEAESREVEFTAEWEPGEDVQEFLRAATGRTGTTVVMTGERSWAQRLFTWPWRPLHRWIVFSGEAEVTGVDDRGDGTAELKMVGIGDMSQELRIRQPK